MKRTALKALTSVALRGLFRRWTRSTTPIVMLHRFSAGHVPGRVSAETLSDVLQAVRDTGLQVLSLGDLAGSLSRGVVPPKSICFTVDDGYRDFADVAHPVFRRFGMPVTVFPIAAFVDGAMWNWWDRITFALENSSKPNAALLDARDRPLDGSSETTLVAERMIASCKEVSDERKESAIERLIGQLGVKLPERPPADCGAMDWDTVGRLASEGVEFGGHTVTHPVLSQVDDERLASEIEGSFEALKRATGAEVRCFAYPNGRERDFDDRAVDLLRRRGVAAVTAEYGIVSRATLERDDALYRLPRVSLSEDPVRRMALIAGVEAARIDVGGG